MIRVLLVLATLLGASVLVAPVASAQTTWLCRPGQQDPCGGGSGAPIDCFYVYPTASLQPTSNADLSAGPEIAAVAALQARPFDSVCNVWAPVYRQSTLSGLATQPGPARDAALEVAYGDIQRAWDDYAAQRSPDRKVVLIGHSQGTRMLRELIQKRVDTDPTTRDALALAILLGGQIRADDFTSVTPCTDPAQTGCVVAFSTFNTAPPQDSRFGGDGIVCTNPASLAANEREPVRGLAPDYTAGYTAQCDQSNVLQIRGGTSALIPALPTASWGLHLLDMTVAQDDLVDLVRSRT